MKLVLKSNPKIRPNLPFQKGRHAYEWRKCAGRVCGMSYQVPSTTEYQCYNEAGSFTT